ncbi:MAG: glucosaminidase domain-containing protein, partial [Erysipelotrichaceae bacterium]|nr:glucosaminidase domain-containing protein [Erysipelotrichaceae bacterium]
MKFNSILLTGLCVFMAMPVMMMETCEATDNAPDGMVTESFTVIDDEGNVEIIYANDIDGEFIEPEAEVYDAIGGDPNVECGVVYINTNNVTEYKHAYTGATGYITGSYAIDAAYIGYYNDKVRAKIDGVVDDFDPEDVKVVEYNGDCDVSYYKQEMGYLKHYYYYGSTHAVASTRVGFSQSYLNDGEAYYSYDGHYFYSTYQNMTLDYQEKSTSRAVNSDSPYYNYYQYVSHRSTSSLSGDELDQIAIDTMGWDEYANSALYNLGNSFVENQNNYFVNAMCMYGVAANESNWGRSYIAKERNNLFGHGAVDNNPYYGSNGYDSPEYSITYHAYNFASRGYLDYGDWRYFGGCLGDKAVGFNVKY